MSDSKKIEGIFRDCAAGNWGCIFVPLLLAYGLAHSVLRLAFSRNLPQDDVTSNLFAQTFELGYTEWQPPLYEWLLWCVQHLTGPTLPSFLLIKYVLLATTLGLLYLAATRLFEDARWAALSALSLLLTYQIGWVLNEGVTQTIVLMCAVAGSLWTLMRVAERGALRDYLLFGIFLGLGLLSKFNYVGFLLALGASCLLQPTLRARLLTWKILLSLVTAGLMASPYLYWLLAREDDLITLYRSWLAPEHDGRLKATLVGLGRSMFSPLAFLFPLDVILPLCFPRMIPEMIASFRRAVRGIYEQEKPDWETLLLHITLSGFVILMLGALVTGASRYLEFYMYPFFLLTPLWLMSMAKRGQVNPRQIKAFTVLLFGTLVFAFLARAVHLGLELGPLCDRCRTAIPYDALALALKERGFGNGTVIAPDRHLAGNLRRMLPDARIVCLKSPFYVPPTLANDFSSKTVLVWPLRPGEKSLPKAGRELLAELGGKTHGRPERISLAKQSLLNSTSPRIWDWLIQAVDLASRDGTAMPSY